MKAFARFVPAFALFFLAACGGAKSARGFRLPDGDVQAGKATFVTLQCHACHSVVGTELPDHEARSETLVALGGEVRRVKTYGQLVTAIIHPTHSLAPGYAPQDVSKDGKSTMPNFNETMTVQQLIDMVTFLQAQYRIRRDDDLYYPYL